ncbi:MAG TPA: peptidoglycan editing factor PgeF [Candidatus Cybelea sp.]|nr:peptidoglycan editing factor PgeF [Candidatus Cybelea sp.]
MPAGRRKKKAPPRAANWDTQPNSGWSLRRRNALSVLEFSGLAGLDWLVHGFSTRRGGRSQLPDEPGGEKAEGVLNLGFTEWDDRARVEENRREFAAAIRAPKHEMVTLKQMHSDIVHLVTSKALPIPPGDAMLTRRPGLLLAVQTADCIPILLADSRTRAVAAVHSGWRGTLKRIAAKTVGRMRMEFGTRPDDVIAALGPGIGGCCYQVGPEVAREFAAQFPLARSWFDGPFDSSAAGENDPNWLPWLTMAPPGHTPEPRPLHLDLIAANRAILMEAGLPSRRIFVSGLCTACRTDLFFSYRKERTTGRLVAAIGIR